MRKVPASASVSAEQWSWWKRAARPGQPDADPGAYYPQPPCGGALPGDGMSGCWTQPEEAGAGDTVIIRSHGVSRDVYRHLEATGANIVDATCPFVKRIHKLVAQAEAEGKLPIIIGTPTHPEVEGIAGGVRTAGCLKMWKPWKNGFRRRMSPRICQFVWFHKQRPQKFCGKNASIMQKNSLLTCKNLIQYVEQQSVGKGKHPN